MRPVSNTGPVRAGIYCRLSLSRDGDTTKVDDQQRICRDLAARLGWEIAEGCGHPFPDGVYTDNNKSAWRHDRKRRGWDLMLADVEAGRINAIVVYHGDRLIRQPRDLEDLIDLSRGRGIRLASPTGTRDLSSDEDQFILSIEAAMARRESANISRRQKNRFDRWEREGRVFSGGHGGRRFGFETDGVTIRAPGWCEVATRREVSEADILREVADRILAGQSARSIAKDLKARGVTSAAGKVFDGQDLRRMLMLPRYAGLMPDGETKAAWEPVLDRETWERVRLLLEARAVGPRGSKEPLYLLSGIAICGACDTPMQTAYFSSRGYKYRLYACGRRAGCGRVFRNGDHLDTYVIARVIALLNDPRHPEGELPVRADDSAEWALLAAERADTEKLAQDYAASPGRLRLLMGRLDRIDKRMAELRELETTDARSRLLGRYRGITRAEWDALPLEVRRALVAASYRVVVLPASGRGPGFRTADVRLDPA